jgi:uncharacterized coiled-coil protein SlyX
MSIATDAKVRELEKRVIELEKTISEQGGRIIMLEMGTSPSERRKVAEKIMTKARELTDI